MWIVCLGISCQQLELTEVVYFKTKEECEKMALEGAQFLAKQYDRVGYKCVKSDNI